LENSILITGATGGLGIALVAEARARGLHVLATGRSSHLQAQIESFGARFVRADLLDPGIMASLLQGQSGIIHAAALSTSWGDYDAFHAANVEMTRNLLTVAQDRNIQRFIYVSSPSIFATFKDRLRIKDQDSPSNPPLNPYAQTKLIAERMVLAAAKPGFASVAIRPRALVGPNDRVLLPRLMALARRPAMPLPRGGKALIELTDVRDAAAAILAAYDHGDHVSGQAFNISGGKPVSVREVAVKLAEAIGASPKLIDLPMAIAAPLAASLEAIAGLLKSRVEPILTRYTLATLAYSQTFDLSGAREALDWRPTYDGFETLLHEAGRMRE
jgi:nucleoside-diphosphate-sugar epimerase